MQQSVAVLGLGYVGLPLAVGLAEGGTRVVGFDHNPTRVAELLAGVSPTEDVSSDRLSEALQGGMSVTCDIGDIAGLDSYVVCVPTPLQSSGHPDLSFVDSAVQTVAVVMRRGALVVLESTTYPGTTEERVLPMLTELTGLNPGKDYFLAYSPERIDPGNAKFGINNTPKIIGAVDQLTLQRAVSLYEALGVELVIAKTPREAELAKLLENTYRQVNIALVNELSQFCYALDIDIFDAIRCAATKPFGFEPFWPGPGVGGHCIPIDPSYLSHRVRAELGQSFRLVELAQEVNASMPAFVASRVTRALNEQGRSVRGSRICLLGVAYKSGVADTRESPAYPLGEILQSQGASLSYWDPCVARFSLGEVIVPRVTMEQMRADPVDVAVVLQEHPEVRSAVGTAISCGWVDTRGFSQ